MSRVNSTRKTKTERTKHLNWMGGHSWDIDNPLVRLQVAASSCFFGEPMYYHRDEDDSRRVKASRVYPRRLNDRDVSYLRETLDAIDPQEWRSKNPTELMESAIDDALDFDAEATLQFAARLRNDDYIRLTPQVILVRAAHHPKVKGTQLVRTYAPQILKRADEPANGLAYHFWRYEDAPIPNSLKRAYADYLSTLNEYQLGKYRMEGRAVSTVDVVNLVHPKNTVAIKKLVNDELRISGETWEALVSAEGSTKEAWTKALSKMGHMALLRNLRNLEQSGVDTSLFTSKLIEGAEKGQQLPFRYWSAYNAVKRAGGSPVVLDAVEECLEVSLGNLPHFSGRVISLCDNSGSAKGTTTSSLGSVQMSTIANLTGVITGKVADEGFVGIFGDRLEIMPVTKKGSVMQHLEEANRIGDGIGGGTENGIWLFFRDAIKNKDFYDHIFVYSDMQAGHGGLFGLRTSDYADFGWPSNTRMIDVPKLVNKYRAEVNPDVQVYLVQVAGYQDTIIPEFYDKTYILGGWSEGLLKWAAMLSGVSQAVPQQA